MRKKLIIELSLGVFLVISLLVFERWIQRGPWYPLPAFVIVFGVIGAFIVARRIRVKMNEPRGDPEARPCPKCEYDLRGNVTGRCPECGTPVERAVQT